MQMVYGDGEKNTDGNLLGTIVGGSGGEKGQTIE